MSAAAAPARCPIPHPRLPFKARLADLGPYLLQHPFPWLISEISRRWARVAYLPGLGYLVSDAAVAHELLLRDDDFTKNGPGSMGEIITQVMGPYALLNMDGSAHRELRARLGDLFAPAYVEQVAREVFTEPLATLRAQLEAGQPVDLVRFARLLGARVTCRLLGIPVPPENAEATYLDVFTLATQLTTHAHIAGGRLTEQQRIEASQPYEQLLAHARGAYEAEDAADGSIIDRLRRLGLSFDEVKGVLATIFLVGTQTTAVAIPRIVALLVDSGQMRLLQQDPALVSRAVDEGLRFTAPTPLAFRSVARRSEIDGHTFEPGRRVVIFTYNLARDPALFPQPTEFDITRQHDPRSRHLWYGAGPHFCLGFVLAQRELRAVFETLASVKRPLAIADRQYDRQALLPSYGRLTLRAAA